MGLLIDGVWHDQWYDTKATGGKFVRQDSALRNWVTADGAPGPSGTAGFQAETGRYHLYVSLACPWASRALIYRKLKSLEDIVSLSVTHWHMGSDGWTFAQDDGVMPDCVNGATFMREVYLRAKPDDTGRVTVPVLWDKKQHTIVSNESSDIIRMFNSAFDSIGAAAGDYYPEGLRAGIDAINARIYPGLNNGVYRAGFATTQGAYDTAAKEVFETMDWLEETLSRSRFLLGDMPLESDWRLALLPGNWSILNWSFPL